VIGVSDEQRLARLRTLLKRTTGASVFAFWAEGAYPRITESVLGARLPWVAARREADELLYEEIVAHRADPGGRDDVLALLIAAGGRDERPLTDAELHDQLTTLLVAGHDTTAAALAWCFELLVHHPSYLERLQDEIAGSNGDGKYLDAVVNETLRVRPVIDAALRKLARPMELGGYTLPAGTIVAASILGVQHSHAYEYPEEFRPERFLERPALPYTLIPFGGGMRRCLGASFAVMEIKTILQTVIGHAALQAPTRRPERPVRWRRLTVLPARGGRVIVTARRSA
jgi:cytochrome P450 family 135